MTARLVQRTAAALVLLAAIGCSKTEAPAPGPGAPSPGASASAGKAQKPPRNVQVVVATAGSLEEGVRLTGHLEALRKAEINSRLTGQVAEVLVREGDRVQAGQPLLRLVDTDARARARQARSNLEAARAKRAQAEAGHGLTGTQVELEVRRVAQGVSQAESALARSEAELADAKLDLERQKGLFDEGAVPQIRVEQAQLRHDVALRNTESARSQLRSARESLELARANTRQTQVTGADVTAATAAVGQAEAALEAAENDLEDTVLTSPMSGVVVERAIEPGQTTSAMAGKPLLVVVDNSSLEMLAPLDERLARFVHRGSPVRVETSIQEQPIEGRVAEVVPASDATTHTVRVRIRVPNPSRTLMSGAFATVLLNAGTHRGILVPRDAVQRREDQVFVFVQEGDVARRRDVQVRYESPTQSVLTGLSAGEKVITAGAVGLEDGQKVVLSAEEPSGAASPASPVPSPAAAGTGGEGSR